ncbi:hypothetical protein T08_15544 [Trichinella sp. T8]|nr:hypothetical protein T08_15544 [Trichinella sp. T8]
MFNWTNNRNINKDLLLIAFNLMKQAYLLHQDQ